MNLPPDYRYLIDDKHFSEEEILSKFESLHEYFLEYLKTREDNKKKLCLHEGKLEDVVYNYFADLARLKAFHDIKLESPIKQASYIAFWILRCAPIQIIDNSKEPRYPNEVIAISIILAECKKALGNTLSKAQATTLHHLGKELDYYFKFRHYSQQSIEIMLQAFMSGLASKE